MKEIIIDGITYFDTDEKMSFNDALEWAKSNGLRLLKRSEWCELWDNSEEFRKSSRDKHWWTGSVNSNNRSYAWNFNGYNGYVNSLYRYSSYAVRCVKRRPGGVTANSNEEGGGSD